RPERGADRFDHQRCARADVGGTAVGRVGPRADRIGFTERARGVAAAESGRYGAHVVDPLAVAQGPCRGCAGPATPLVAGAWRVGCRTGLYCNGFHSRLADHWVRPAGADLQTADADAARPGPDGEAAARREAADSADRGWQVPSRRPRREGPDPADSHVNGPRA